MIYYFIMADYESFTKAYEELERWMAEPSLLPVLKRDAERLALSWQNNSGEEELKNEIVNRFGQSLSVQGGSVRQLTGAGLNRMNIFTARRLSEALSVLLRSDPSRFGGKADKHANPVVVVGYDTRNSSDRFALEVSAVLIASGIRVRLMPKPVPLPFLSFAVPFYGASAGVMVTGGRNPAYYSGMKFHTSSGALFSEEESALLAEEMAKIDPFSGVNIIPVDDPSFLTVTGKDGKPLLSSVEEDCKNAYLKSVTEACPRPKYDDVRVVLTTMNGAANVAMSDLFQKNGISNVSVVPDQAEPDGSFTTCPTPNPEKAESLRKALALAEELRDPDVVLALSPDAGRFGMAVRDLEPKEGKGSFVPLSGAQTAALFLDYLCMVKAPSADSVFIKSETAPELLDSVARHYNIRTITVPSGFRAVADALDKLAAEGSSSKFLLAYDGASGFLVSPDLRQKDGLEAALLAVDMAAYHKHMKKGALDRLAELSEAYGYYREREIEFRVGDNAPEQIPMDIIDEEGVRIYVRKSRVDDKIRVNLSLSKDTDEEASKALNEAEFSIRGKVKEWFRSTKR